MLNLKAASPVSVRRVETIDQMRVLYACWWFLTYHDHDQCQDAMSSSDTKIISDQASSYHDGASLLPRYDEWTWTTLIT